MIDPELLRSMCCPETHQELHMADPALLEKLNQRIAAGGLNNRAGRAVKDKITAALVRADGKFIYPIRDDIPVMLVEEAIPIAL